MTPVKQHRGVIYILTNPSFPEYVKIGYANDLETRMRQLNRNETIPFAYRVYAVYDVDHRLTDKELHGLIDMLNPDLRSVETFNGKTRTKEFFAMMPRSEGLESRARAFDGRARGLASPAQSGCRKGGETDCLRASPAERTATA